MYIIYTSALYSIDGLLLCISPTFPLIGSTILLFDTCQRGSSRNSAVFSMRARLKKFAGSPVGLTTSTRAFEPSPPVEIEVRCLRAPSRSALEEQCNAASNWIWWLHNAGSRLLPSSSHEWIYSIV